MKLLKKLIVHVRLASVKIACRYYFFRQFILQWIETFSYLIIQIAFTIQNLQQARLATKKAKPNGQFYLTKENVEAYFADVSLGDLPGLIIVILSKIYYVFRINKTIFFPECRYWSSDGIKIEKFRIYDMSIFEIEQFKFLKKTFR